jgi:antitoxin ParD1/3/4
MAKKADPKRATSFALGDELERYVNQKVASGKDRSASEVMREALTHMAEQDRKEAALDEALDRGLASPIAPDGVFERVRERIARRRRRTA